MPAHPTQRIDELARRPIAIASGGTGDPTAVRASRSLFAVGGNPGKPGADETGRR